jgi:hypothetical protein
LRLAAVLSAFILTVACFAFSLPLSCAHAATAVEADIDGDVRWTPADGPYWVARTVRVLPGATLTIAPGVQVRFAARAGLVVEHQLIARGTAAAPIVFTGDGASAAPGLWDGLSFTETAVNAVLDADGRYLSGSVLEHCQVRHAGPAVTCEQSAPLIAFCELADNASPGPGGGIYTTGDAVILNNTITGNAATGWYGAGGGIYAAGTAAVIAGNLIADNRALGPGGGIFAAEGTLVAGNIVIRNTANGDGGGIYTYFGAPTVTGNSIRGNAAGGAGGGLHLELGTAAVSENRVLDNTAAVAGGGVSCNGNRVSISRNHIQGNRCDGFGDGLFSGNDAFLSQPPLALTDNNLFDNEEEDLYNDQRIYLSAVSHYWGELLPAEIGRRIHDGHDDKTRGPVIFDPPATAPHGVPLFSVFPASHDFVNVPVGESAIRTFTLVNLAGVDLSDAAFAIEGAGAADFAVADIRCGDGTLAADARCLFDVRFSPRTQDAQQVSLKISCMQGPERNLLAVPLTGNRRPDVLPGDINTDGVVDLQDAVLALQVISGPEPLAAGCRYADVDGDGRIGLSEVVFILQTVGALRPGP